MKIGYCVLSFILFLVETVPPIEASQRFWSRGLAESIYSSSLNVQRRLYHLPHVDRGVYVQPTEDAIFKHLMSDREVRNSFLQSVLGENVNSSEILDASLNPVKSYQALRECVNDKRFVKLMKDIDRGKQKIDVRHETTNIQLHQAKDFLVRLAPLYYELVQALPDADRNTQLDLICDTPSGIINVEMQVDPQNFWDIRILAHVCGLFHRQFPKGFAWSQLETGLTNTRVKRVIGVSLFEKAPVAPSSVQTILPWYSMEPWKNNELRRHYKLTDTTNTKMHRAGIEFLDYNLASLSYPGWDKTVSSKNKALREWLHFFAEAQKHSLRDVQKNVNSQHVKKAYHMIESATLPQKVKKAYEEDMKRRYNISHYVQSEVRKGENKGKEEGKAEVAKAAMKKGLSDDVIVDITGLPLSTIKSLRGS